MKKSVVFFFLLALISCGSPKPPTQLIVDNLTSTLGNPVKLNISDPSDQFIVCENIPMIQNERIFNIADKSLNTLPVKAKEYAYSDSHYYDMKEYETPEYRLTIENHFMPTGDSLSIRVKLFITNK